MAFALSNLFKSSTPAAPSIDPAAVTRGYKVEALENARSTAQSEARMPTLEDYRLACIALGEAKQLPANEWNPRSYADLSGMTISGFEISDPRIQQKHRKQG